MKNEASSPLNQFLLQRMSDANISCTTLVFTFFCDVVTQHGGEIWLGSIIHALAPLGIKQRSTRTAVFRLVRDGWLESHKQGRRSYYRLTQTGQNYYQRAADRIYAGSKTEWDGAWTILFTALVPEQKRDALNRGLLWLGYGRMAAGVYAQPCDTRPQLRELLTDLNLEDSVVHMQAQAGCDESLKRLVLSHWKLDDLRQKYKTFTSHYLEARGALNNISPPNGHTLLLLRILLVHEYRRILLSDPELPAEMLPADWEAYAAQSLTGEIYRQLAGPTTQWVNQELLNADGNMNNSASILSNRFLNDSAG